MIEVNQTVASAITNGPANVTANGGGTSFVGTDAVNLYRIVMFHHALSLEIEAGIKMFRGSTLAAVNRMCGTNFRRKQAAHDYLTLVIAHAKGEQP